jgi:hypothetical protein
MTIVTETTEYPIVFLRTPSPLAAHVLDGAAYIGCILPQLRVGPFIFWDRIKKGSPSAQGFTNSTINLCEQRTLIHY